MCDQQRAERGAHQWHDDENAEQAVDDAGNSGEQVNQERDDVADFAGSELGEKNSAGEAEWHG